MTRREIFSFKKNPHGDILYFSNVFVTLKELMKKSKVRKWKTIFYNSSTFLSFSIFLSIHNYSVRACTTFSFKSLTRIMLALLLTEYSINTHSANWQHRSLVLLLKLSDPNKNVTTTNKTTTTTESYARRLKWFILIIHSLFTTLFDVYLLFSCFHFVQDFYPLRLKGGKNLRKIFHLCW